MKISTIIISLWVLFCTIYFAPTFESNNPDFRITSFSYGKYIPGKHNMK